MLKCCPSLVQRLKKIIVNLINKDLLDYITHRFIGFNSRQIHDNKDYADAYKVKGAIVFVDFQKAFDTFELEFMLDTLNVKTTLNI